MNIGFTPEAWEDYMYWQSTNQQIVERINLLLKDTLRNPKEGIGKPEPLKWGLSGCWSRRIDREHRLI
jgi:toxin YoeB